MVVCALPHVLIIQNLRKTSWTNHCKAVFGAAKDIHNGDMSFLASDENLLRQVAAVHRLKIVQEDTLEQWVPFGCVYVIDVH